MSEKLDNRLKAVFQAGGDPSTLAQLYDQWAIDYDRDIWASGNPYIAILGGLVGRHVPSFEARILDAGCGTGLVGQILHQIGYRNLVGLDISIGMLQVAEEKGYYAELYEGPLGPTVSLPENSFDAITAAGVLTHGHAPPSSLDGLLAIAKPGAPLIFSLSEPAALEGGFDQKMDSLEQSGLWTLVEKTPQFRSFPFSEQEAHLRNWVYVYRKLPR